MPDYAPKKMKAIGLGKGLGALIPKDSHTTITTTHPAGYTLPVDDGNIVGGTAMVDIHLVRPNRFQPRQDFDPAALEDLTKSIREKGVIQPITVRRVNNEYELVAGERRYRASIEAELTQIPAYIIDVQTDAEMLELALIENVQRENLNPIEIALGYQRLIEECSLTQDQVAVKVGKDRTTVTNFLRLLRLGKASQDALRTKKITMGHARAMLSLGTEDLQEQVMRDVVNKGLSVRSTESLIRDIELGKVKFGQKPIHDTGVNALRPLTNAPSLEVTSTLNEIEAQLRAIFGTNVKVRTKSASGAGAIEMDFYSIEDLERLIDLFVIIERAQL